MKATPYWYYARELEYSGSKEDWEFISESLDKHREEAEHELELAKAEYAVSVEREERVLSLLKNSEQNEHLFYKLHLLLAHDHEEIQADRLATNISFLRHPPKTLHGIIHRSFKVNDLTIDTKKASYLFEEISDHLLYSKSILWVSICYLQEYTFFLFDYYYDVVGKRIAKGYRKPGIRIVEPDNAMKMLKTRRLLKKFMKHHPAVYAGYLMDK